MKTFPVAVKFMKDKEPFPEKTRQPSVAMGKRITICQGVTMARNYGWMVGMTREDLICVPAAIAFGLSESSDPPPPSPDFSRRSPFRAPGKQRIVKRPP